MCARCHKRIAVVFITKMENGQRTSEGLCMRCAKEVGLPVNNMLDGIAGQMGITPEQIASMEDSMNEMMAAPSESDGVEDGGAPAIDMPSLFGEDGVGEDDGNNLGKSLAAMFGELRKNSENHPAPRHPEDNGKKKGTQSGQSKSKSGKELKYLTTYCRNLTEAARRGKLDRIVGRERELARVTQILCRRQKNNPCLIGEPGVGKTAIAEALAIRVAKGDVPYKLKSKEIYLVDLTALVAGTQFRGQFESRILGLLGEVRSEGNIILVIDEVHNIVGTGEAEGSVNAANILKPALSRGEVQIIGATTLTEYRKYIEKDTALERRFQPVMVEEPSISESVDMLRGIKHYYEEYHNIVIPEGVLVKAVTMSERYITDRYLPDKAIDLLDEAAAHELASVIEVWTGIPATTITENEFEQVDKLEARLKEHIVGQDKAVNAVARAVKRNRAGVSAKRKPVSFIFAGPTGVGKTELVKTLANDLFHSPETLIRLDMSEFMEKESVSRIIGSPPGYVGYDDAGQLTEKIRRKPYSVVLFDEIEKAHPDVLNILLQILDDGRLTDAHGKTVNFENTVIVMTTNAGSDRQTASIGFGAAEDMAEDATMKALSAFLRPEFINRVDEVITFRSLDQADFTRIVRIMLGELVEALAEKSLTLKYTDAAAAHIAEKSFSAKYGARNMRRYIQRNVEDAIAEAVISDYTHSLTHILVHVKDGELKVTCM
ncbi:MAG: ATP-dependent Clp protease ATP-binding subunit [Clostridia bacterium]|nr:ATP-dependent Clp protease ATP-binding subunit [Clostridia bacterium]